MAGGKEGGKREGGREGGKGEGESSCSLCHYSKKPLQYSPLSSFSLPLLSHCKVVIRNAGHILPYDQPEVALAMLQNFIDLPPHP